MSRKMRTLIVDDEPLARKGLTVRLSDNEAVQVIGECTNGREAVQAIKSQSPDLVFLDIQMPVLNGFQVLAQLESEGVDLPVIIFVTAYDNYAMKAFEVHALDYLLKPVEDNRLMEAIQKAQGQLSAKQNMGQKNRLVSLVSQFTGDDCEDILRRLASGESLESRRYPDHLSIKDGGEVTVLKTHTISWIDAAGDYMCVHSIDGKTHIMRKTMKELEAELNPDKFVRIHRSVMVNKNQVEKLVTHASGEYHLVLENGQELKVSRSYKEKAKAIINMP
ncbi:MAG: two-component system LytT family response regulator [Alteromonadaceae bacterium]|jgi:two-component system LytT family response regulator